MAWPNPIKKLKNWYDDPNIRPWFFIILIPVLALDFQYMFPFYLTVPWFIETLGWLMVTISLIIFLAAQLFIENAGAEAKTKGLLTEGLFSYSRHPMYLNFMLALIGVGIGTGAIWFIVIGFAAGPLFNDFVIPDEEKYLEAKFGRKWTDYQNKTPKWL